MFLHKGCCSESLWEWLMRACLLILAFPPRPPFPLTPNLPPYCPHPPPPPSQTLHLLTEKPQNIICFWSSSFKPCLISRITIYTHPFCHTLWLLREPSERGQSFKLEMLPWKIPIEAFLELADGTFRCWWLHSLAVKGERNSRPNDKSGQN